MTLTIFKGKVVFPSLKREISLSNPKIERAEIPARATIPLIHLGGGTARPCVREGESVYAGTKIGEPDGAHSAAVHASVSGFVKTIGSFPHPYLGEAPAIQIESDGRDVQDPTLKGRDADRLSREEIYGLLEESGLVDPGYPPLPIHELLDPWKDPPVKTVILNGLDGEPYLVANYLLMIERSHELIQGARLIRQFLGADRILLAAGEGSLEGLETVNSKLFSLRENFLEAVSLPDDYPQGEPGQLVRALLSKEVPRGKNPREAGVVVLRLETVIGLWEAIKLGKPFYERVVTVSGECVVQPKNLLARIGTPLRDLIRGCHGFLRQPGRLVAGSVMTGVHQENLDAPVDKILNALIALPPEENFNGSVQPCIRCGFCIEACPADLNPSMITMASESAQYALAEEFGLSECVHCGNCAYVCPSHRPMMALIRQVEGALVHP